MTEEIEVVEPVEMDGIEFYCSKDGEQLGMSQKGLALFCGISETQMRRVLESVRHKTAVLELECLYSKPLDLAITSSRNAKVIEAKACGELVWYYATEKKNPIAKNNLKKFVGLGIQDFIREITGFRKSAVEVPLVMLQEILSTVQRMESKVEVLDKFNKATVTLPGLQYQFKSYGNIGNSLDGCYFSLNQWLISRGLELDKGQKSRLGRMVADLFKCNKQQAPAKISNSVLGISSSGKSTAYKPSDIPMLEVALSKLQQKTLEI